MKKVMKFFLVALVIPAFVMTGCKTTDDPDNAFQTLKDYMVANGMDVPDVLDAWITSASAVGDSATGTVSGYYVLDLRSATDFAAGHIDGAVNTTLGTLLADAANNGGDPILCVCYTGQTAGHANLALRLSGYANAKVLKWGMSGWNTDFDKWSANTGDIAIGNANWTTDPVATNQEFDDPTITTEKTDGAGILAERVDAMLANGFQGVNGSDVLANPGNYFINNYWAQTDVDHYGHIDGAYRISPLTLAGNEYKNLDPSKTIVTYCWTGQTSSMLTAYLNVLGYDAKSLKYGANGMIYSNLTPSHQWSAPVEYNYSN
jgi:rhodanese-related sulfurtransferase